MTVSFVYGVLLDTREYKAATADLQAVTADFITESADIPQKS
jgi:hypothetical protein